MIHFEYIQPHDNLPEGAIKINLDYDSSNHFNEKQFPLHLLHKTLSGEVIWNTELFPGWFSQYGQTHTTVEIIDSTGNKLFEWKWDPFINGDYAHKVFEVWSMNNIGANGIAIGTHNGMSGEWVGPVNKGLLKATLVEVSEPQFQELLKYYTRKSWVKCVQSLITTDGKDITFYEGGSGQTNSLSKDVIKKHMGEDKITETIKSSKSINDLIIESSEYGKVKWIHIDVEGMDGELIYAINDDLLPELLLFESLHMDNEYYNKLCNYLTVIGYSITKSGWNTICRK